MRRLLNILILLACTAVSAQEFADSPTALRIDSSYVTVTPFADLSEEYSGADYIYEYKAPEKTAWDRFKEWLAHKIANLFNMGSTEKSLDIVETVLKVIAGLIVLVVVYLIVKSALRKEGKWLFGRDLSKKVIHHDEIEKNLQSTDFDKLIKETIESGQMRLAIRYYYLWLLKKLSERGTIQFDAEKTNSDYLREITSVPQKEEFGYLSYLYNYIWYGAFDIDQATFEKAKKAFEKAIR